MKRNRRNNLMITLSILVVLVVGITIVYAALSASLKISTSNVTQNVASWNVGFEVGSGTVKGTARNFNGSSTAGISCGDATVTANSISVGATILTKPEDQCVWLVTVKNTGTIDAKLTSIKTTSPSEEECTGTNTGYITCGNIAYFLENQLGILPLKVNDVINADDSILVAVVARYTGENLNASQVVHTGVGFTFVWSQY